MTVHALWRALVLILLGVFLRSVGHPQTRWTFEDTLTQIGLGYFFLFLLGQRPVREQWAALGVILVGLLGRLCALPAARRRALTTTAWACRRPGRAAPAHRLRRALEQEQQPRLGLRHLVPEPLPAREAVRVQRRRVCHAQLHPDAGHDDPGPDRRRRAAQRARAVGQGEMAGHRRAASGWPRARSLAGSASARSSSASGRRAGCSSAAAGASCSWPGSTSLIDVLGRRPGRSR